MKIDVHAHLFSPAYIQGLQRIFGNDSTPVGQDAQRLIRWMNSDPRMIEVEGRVGCNGVTSGSQRAARRLARRPKPTSSAFTMTLSVETCRPYAWLSRCLG